MSESQGTSAHHRAGSGGDANQLTVATRDQVIEWMRESRGSAADFYEAAANYFGVEEEELTED